MFLRIGKILIFFILLGVLIIGVIKFTPFNYWEDNFHRIAFKMKDDLLRNTKSPKIILFGGSNVGVGVDSEFLQYKTGYNIVNMAFSAPYRYRIFLELLEDVNWNEGDIVVSVPEYIDYKHDLFWLYKMIRLYPEVVDYFHFPEDYDFVIFLKWLNSLGVRYFELDQGEHLWTEYLNEYGDTMTYRLKKKGNPECKNSGFSTANFDYNLDMVQNFANRMRDKGVKFLFGFPVLMKDCYSVDNQYLIQNYDSFLKNNGDFDVVGDPERYLFDKEMMFDTMWHVNYKGRKIRTERLLDDISPFLDKIKINDEANIDFQKVELNLINFDEIKSGQSLIAKLKIVNKGYSNLSYLYGYLIKVFEYKDISSVKFGIKGNSVGYQLSGWSHQEDGFTWTEGKESSLVIPVKKINKDVVINVSAGPLVDINGDSVQVVEVYAGKHFITSWKVVDSGIYQAVIPRKYIGKSNLELNFKFPNAMKASDAGHNDTRVLAIRFYQIDFNFYFESFSVKNVDFPKDVKLKNGDEYVVEVPLDVKDADGWYKIKIGCYRMEDLIPGGIVEKEIYFSK